MVILSDKTLRRFQSLAWISPEGGIIPIEGDDMHSDVAETFPGIPSDEQYPTNYAIERLGYLKVGNAFDFAYDSDAPARNVDRGQQFDAMAQIVAQAAIKFMTRGLPNWFLPPAEYKGEPDRWLVHMVDINDGLVRKTNVKRFIREHGFDTTKEWFDYQMYKAEEAMLRNQVRMILSELRRKPV